MANNFRMRLAVAGSLSLTLLLAGCGAGSDSTEKSQSEVDKGGLARATATLDEFRGIPEFVAPGPEFDASAAAGKTVFYIPLTSEIPYLAFVQESLEEALDKVGAKLIASTNQGDPAQWAQAINQAISRKVDAIVMYDIPVELVAPQLKAAKDAGIPVIQKHNADPSEDRFAKDLELLASNLPAPWVRAGELIAAQAIVDSKGKADTIVVTSNDHLGARTIVKGIEDTMKADCPACNVTLVDVPLSDWSSKIQPQLQTALLKNPDANYVLPVFDGMMQWVKPAITASGSGRDIGIATFNATPFVMDMLREGELVRMNVGESYRWIGWALADQSMRLMTGVEPVEDDLIPVRVFTEETAAEVGVPADITEGYGDAFIEGYLNLWGVN